MLFIVTMISQSTLINNIPLSTYFSVHTAQFDVEFYDELISGYQWLEGKKRAPRAKKAKSKPHEDLRGSAFLQALAEQDSDSSPCEPPGGDTPLLGENKDSEDSESSEKIKVGVLLESA